jgi:thiamine kinase-like enzyme
MVKTVRRFLFINKINILDYDKVYDFFFNDAELLVDIKDEPSYVKDMYETMIKNIDNMTNEDMIYIKQLIEGFKELVNNNIYNFDLHPGNVLFNKDGVLKLIDYDYNIVIDKNLDNIYNKKYPMKNRVKI